MLIKLFYATHSTIRFCSEYMTKGISGTIIYIIINKRKCNSFKRRAAIKCSASYTCHTTGDYYALNLRSVDKSIFRYRINVGRYRYVFVISKICDQGLTFFTIIYYCEFFVAYSESTANRAYIFFRG